MRFLKHLTLVSLCCACLTIHAQSEIGQILRSSNNFQEIVEQADAYFAGKYPGKSSAELTRGEFRDGSFVKYMRWKSYWQNRLNPDGTLGDPTAYYRSERIESRNEGPYENMPWTNISLPFNLGGQIGVGRTTSVAFHPTDVKTFWVSTAIGGIWKTMDGGQSYEPLGDDLPTLAVSVVLVDPSNPDILYAATGDRVWYGPEGIGVYKSTDGGRNWTVTALNWGIVQRQRIYALAINPDNPKEILAASTAGIFKTIDGFETVDLVIDAYGYDVAFKPNDSNVVYATAGNSVFRSLDGGDTFEQATVIFSPRFIRLTVSPADPERVYASNGNSYYPSYDGGETFGGFEDISQLDNGDFGYILMSHQDPNVLYGGYFNTWRSKNNGNAWEQITCFSGGPEIHVDNHFAAINPLEPEYIYFCNDGGLYKFIENDCDNCDACFDTYQDISGGMRISQYYDISHSQQRYNIIGGGTQDNGSFFRSVSGQWQFYASTGDGMIGHIDPQDDLYRYWTYQLGSIFRFYNGINTCISCRIPNGEDGNGEWVTPYELDPNNPEVIVAGFKRVYRSVDRGDSWIDLTGPVGNEKFDHIVIAPSDSDVIYAVESWSNRIYKTTNASAGEESSWENYPISGFNQLSSLTIDPNDASVLYATRGGYVTGSKVFKSVNGGRNWTNISGTLPNVVMNDIEFIKDPAYEDGLLLATDAGIFYRDASLDDWEPYGKLPHTRAQDIEIQYTNRLIRVGTHGRSIFEAPLPDNPCLTDTPPDTDLDGICDAFDSCPEGDNNIDTDNDGVPDACETFCLAAGADGTGSDYITLVVLNSINNVSMQTGYSDFTELSTDLVIGDFYTLEVGLQFSFDIDKAYAWIDYNQDKEFSEDERINMSGFDANHISIGEFSVPEGALMGPTVLRVRNIYTDQDNPDPCNSFFGEVEDYTVNIVGNPNGLEDLEDKQSGIVLYPNPVDHILQVYIKGMQSDQLTLSILNVAGQVVIQRRLNQTLEEETRSIFMKDLVPGLYTVQVSNGNQMAVERFVKR